jgi:hypothetical protein
VDQPPHLTQPSRRRPARFGGCLQLFGLALLATSGCPAASPVDEPSADAGAVVDGGLAPADSGVLKSDAGGLDVAAPAPDGGRPPVDVGPPAPTCEDGVHNGDESDVDCGGTCPLCAAGQLCREGSDCSSGVCTTERCAHHGLGSGRDGSRRVVDEGVVINASTHLTGGAAEGALRLPVASAIGFRPGDEVMVVQSQGERAGVYEFARVEAIDEEGKLVLAAALTFNYNSGVFDQPGSEVTQVVQVPHFTDLTIAENASIVAAPWDGRSGGIVALRAVGRVSVGGSILAAGAGYRNSWGAVSPGNWHHSGEGTLGGSPAQRGENLRGGGGGGFDDSGGFHGGGGGGSHASPGTDGLANTSSPGAVGGLGATSVYGTADLSLLFFGGGGAGGTGHGGGIIFIKAASIDLAGSISATGMDGHCEHNRWGNGEAGGAGGSILLAAPLLTLGDGRVRATGGRPGDASWIGGGNGCGGRAGGGGEGRIRLDGDQIEGVTQPAAGHRGPFSP